MAMPPCGTFLYAGIVPDTRAARESGEWQLEDKSTADPGWKTLRTDSQYLNRLVGLKPTLRISGQQLVLESHNKFRSELRSASLELDPSFIDSLQAGDILTLLRTEIADIGLSVVRGGRLLLAIGVVTEIPLGDEVVVRNGYVLGDSGNILGPTQLDSWVEVSHSHEVHRLRAGDDKRIGDYRFSVVQCRKIGIPGSGECLAISLYGKCPHEAALRSAELLSRPYGRLTMVKWS